jgi:hypothetical protein
MATKRLIAIPPGYPEELLQPIVRKAKSGGLRADANPDEFMRRLRLLASYYGILESQGNFLSALCVRILSDWVPGFRENQRGRRSDIALREKRDRLVTAVAYLKRKNPDLSDNSACRTLAGATGGIKEFRGTRPETLRKWHRKGLAERNRKNALLAKALKEWRPAPPT